MHVHIHTYTHIHTYVYIYVCMFCAYLAAPTALQETPLRMWPRVRVRLCLPVCLGLCVCVRVYRDWLERRAPRQRRVCVCVCVCACRRVCLVELGPANFLGRAAAAPSRISQKSALQSYHKTNIVQYRLVRISRRCLWARRCSSKKNCSKVSSIVKPHSKYSSVLTFYIFSLVLLDASPQLLEEILKRQRATICTIQKDWWADFWEFFANSLG